MKKFMLAVMIFALSSALFSGCGGQKSETPAPPAQAGRVEGYIYVPIFNERVENEDATSAERTVPTGQKPVQGATVTCTCTTKTTTTDANGYYVFDNVAVGAHTITAVSTTSGYRTITINVTISEKTMTTAPDAVVAPSMAGSLVVNSSPAGAEIYINNTDTGYKTPHTFNPMKAGTHTLYVTIDSYNAPASKEVVVSNNSITETSFVLTKAEATYTGIEITSDSPLAVRNVFLGSQQQLSAKCKFSDGTSIYCTSAATWSSSAPAVGSVGSHSGLFKGLTEGSTQIEVLLDGKTDSITVSVIPADLVSINVTPSASVSIISGLNQQFTAICTYSNNYSANCTSAMTWISTDVGKGTIGANNGLFTAGAVGNTSVYATSGDKTSNTVSVSVSTATLLSISVTPENATLTAGELQQFIARCNYTNGSSLTCTNNVSWVSSNPNVASIATTTGLLTTKIGGTVNVAANWQGKDSNTVAVAVNPPILQRIVVSPESATVDAGFTRQFSAACYYSNDTTVDCTRTVTWSSSDLTKGSIGANTGLFTGILGGQTSVSAVMSGIESSPVLVDVIDLATVSGSVYIEKTNIGIQNVKVEIGDKYAYTDLDGKYSIFEVRVGSADIQASLSGFNTFTGSIALITQPLTTYTLELIAQESNTVQITGKVTNSATHAAINSAQVIVLNPDGSNSQLAFVTDVNGNYQITIPKRTSFSIKVVKSGYTTYQTPLVIQTAPLTFDVALDPS